MILVDTSVWIDHLRTGNAALGRALERDEVLGHPWVIGEVALGHLGRRDEILNLLHGLPQATVASTDEVRAAIENQQLQGSGIGYVDAQLLTAMMLTPESMLWTAGRRLQAVAGRIGREFSQEPPSSRD